MTYRIVSYHNSKQLPDPRLPYPPSVAYIHPCFLSQIDANAAKGRTSTLVPLLGDGRAALLLGVQAVEEEGADDDADDEDIACD